jgi:hypothetical protein
MVEVRWGWTWSGDEVSAGLDDGQVGYRQSVQRQKQAVRRDVYSQRSLRIEDSDVVLCLSFGELTVAVDADAHYCCSRNITKTIIHLWYFRVTGWHGNPSLFSCS